MEKQDIMRIINALERIADALAGTAPAAKPTVQEAAPVAEREDRSDREEMQAAIPDRKAVEALAIKRIQAGKRAEIKELLDRYGVPRVGAVPDDKLADFKAALEVMG